MRHPLFVLLVVLTALAFFQAGYQQLHLPALVASHFNAAGQVDGWMPRAHFFQVQVGLDLGVAAVFSLLALLVSSLPVAAINLPYKSYWFAPERQAATRRRLAGMVLGSGCGALAFFIFLHQRVYLANLDGSRQLSPSFGVVLTVALVLIVGPALAPLRFFFRQPPAP